MAFNLGALYDPKRNLFGAQGPMGGMDPGLRQMMLYQMLGNMGQGMLQGNQQGGFGQGLRAALGGALQGMPDPFALQQFKERQEEQDMKRRLGEEAAASVEQTGEPDFNRLAAGIMRMGDIGAGSNILAQVANRKTAQDRLEQSRVQHEQNYQARLKRLDLQERELKERIRAGDRSASLQSAWQDLQRDRLGLQREMLGETRANRARPRLEEVKEGNEIVTYQVGSDGKRNPIARAPRFQAQAQRTNQAPKTRERLAGANRITEEWDGEKWNLVSVAPRDMQFTVDQQRRLEARYQDEDEDEVPDPEKDPDGFLGWIGGLFGGGQTQAAPPQQPQPDELGITPPPPPAPPGVPYTPPQGPSASGAMPNTVTFQGKQWLIVRRNPDGSMLVRDPQTGDQRTLLGGG